VLAFADDITLLGDSTLVGRAFTRLQNKLRDIGLIVNRRKSKVFGSVDHLNEISLPTDIPRTDEGLIVLGCPVGSVDYIRRESTRIVGKYTEVLPYVLQFPAKIAHVLLSMCINARPNYLTRTAVPWATDQATTLFDTRISKSINSILGFSPNPSQPPVNLNELDSSPVLESVSDRVRSLPISMGGLGMRKSGQTRSYAWSSSWLASMNWLHQNHEGWFQSATNHLMLPDHLVELSKVPLSQLDDRPISSPQDLNSYLGANPSPSPPTQKSLTATLVDLPNKNDLLAQLSVESRKDVKAHFLSECNANSGLWLYHTSSRNPEYKLTQQQFISNLKIRLLVPSLPLGPHQSRYAAKCPCGHWLNPKEVDYHPYSCGAKSQEGFKGPASAAVYRHNSIRDAMVDFLVKVYPLARVESEPSCGIYSADGSILRADLNLALDGRVRYFDVAITNPSSVSNLPTSRRQEPEPLQAARKVENGKTRKYLSKYNPANGFNNFSFTPIVIETTGALGPSAHSLIMDLAGLNELIPKPDDVLASARKRLLIRISVICARAKHQLLTFFQRFAQQEVNSQEYGPYPNHTYRSQSSSSQDVFSTPLVPSSPSSISSQDQYLAIQDSQAQDLSPFTQDSIFPYAQDFAPVPTTYSAQDQDIPSIEHALDL
jgi:hypothetical protein